MVDRQPLRETYGRLVSEYGRTAQISRQGASSAAVHGAPSGVDSSRSPTDGASRIVRQTQAIVDEALPPGRPAAASLSSQSDRPPPPYHSLQHSRPDLNPRDTCALHPASGEDPEAAGSAQINESDFVQNGSENCVLPSYEMTLDLLQP